MHSRTLSHWYTLSCTYERSGFPASILRSCRSPIENSQRYTHTYLSAACSRSADVQVSVGS
ncbi:hypothetical protein M407DRAFT_147112 [Tulasnella calospora MUT 4182]|uniref:Uncharacterized protein n=1 Tax=Tulasnella calospora MUT 4182 TaxID=1051891 RepID=A0A0C3LDH8_9AGAM|nr:hypothetical protein M407DRAFT_147112 [Tulasnella calospora MUT 4182]